jgi:hypothetical protein
LFIYYMISLDGHYSVKHAYHAVFFLKQQEVKIYGTNLFPVVLTRPVIIDSLSHPLLTEFRSHLLQLSDAFYQHNIQDKFPLLEDNVNHMTEGQYHLNPLPYLCFKHHFWQKLKLSLLFTIPEQFTYFMAENMLLVLSKWPDFRAI